MLTLNKLTYLYEHLPMRFDLQIEAGERVAILAIPTRKSGMTPMTRCCAEAATPC